MLKQLFLLHNDTKCE